MMNIQKKVLYSVQPVEPVILTIRNQRVILDADLARIYGVATKVLNQAVKRNREKFPADFMFQLAAQEATNLKSQFVTSSCEGIRSPFVTGSTHGGRRKLPYAFTEHGAIMVATVLNSPRAVQMSVFVVRAFIKIREQLLSRVELEKRLVDIEKTLMGHDTALRDLYQKIRPLLLPPPEPPEKEVTGFRVRERHSDYVVGVKKDCAKIRRLQG